MSLSAIGMSIYQYIAMGVAGIFLLPQLKLCYKIKSAKEISITTIVLLSISSGLWAFYMYENDEIIFTLATLFVFIQSISLGALQVYFYTQRVNEHMASFDKPPPVFTAINQEQPSEV